MKSLKLKSILIFSVIILSKGILAQVDPCLTNLKDASIKYDQGLYDQAIVLLNESLSECDLSKNDKIQAYNLLILNYLAIDKIEEADASAAAIMKIDPNYEADKLRDPAEVIKIFQKYKPTVVLTGMLFGGVNFSSAMASATYSIVSDDDSEGLDNYESQTGFQLGLAAEYRLVNSLWMQLGFQYRQTGYSIDIPDVQGRTISYKEKLTYFDIPLSAKYYFLKGRLQPYVQAGANLSFLNTALGELSRDNINDIVNRKSQRNTFYLGYTAGAGFLYQLKGFGIQANVNYLISPENVNKEGTRYDNLDMVFKYYYLDNDFTMNDLQFNFGITYNLGYRNKLSK